MISEICISVKLTTSVASIHQEDRYQMTLGKKKKNPYHLMLLGTLFLGGVCLPHMLLSP